MTQANTTPEKAIMDWGYRHGLMLTKAQADDLLKTIAGSPTALWGVPKGKYDGQPDHAQRGWTPK